MKRRILNHIKNIPGWKTPRKIVVFAVDDYGNVRLDSRYARQKLDQAGLEISDRFDAYDALETKEDLEMLFDVLGAVQDVHGNPAVFTPYAVPCNLDFEKIAQHHFDDYYYEELPVTFEKLAVRDPKAYEGTWQLWQSGIKNKFLSPEFHGREHLNLRVFREKLSRKDPDLMTALANRSYTSLSDNAPDTVSYTAAFSFWSPEEIAAFPEVVKTGLKAFERVFRKKAQVFTAPSQQFHPSLESILWENDVIGMDRPLLEKQHLGLGKYQRIWNVSGINKKSNTSTMVRNVVFEPSDDRGMDWVTFALKQISAAFFWKVPAIVSSHRVNFSGHIDPENREKGLNQLSKLLEAIKSNWPEVEFLSAGQLACLHLGKNK